VSARERRVIALAAAGGLVGGFLAGEGASWQENLVHLGVYGATAALVAWIALETAAAVISERGRR
jgi:hypothetical protein